ncbi:LysM peptidoglycan-binding domain-containing protein [Anseongella ginsenosidimutans]|nr:LysM peptidoglycan-binding domain-containing protein [Anseongella ginsenosidimutans]
MCSGERTGRNGAFLSRGPAGEETTESQSISHYYYTVKQGDTLYAISKRFNITLDELKEWNSLPSNAISTGQQLRVSR